MFKIENKKEFVTLIIAVGAFLLSLVNFISQRKDKDRDYKFTMAEKINEQRKKEAEIIRKIGYEKINAVRIVNRCDEKIWVSTNYSSITDDVITLGEDVIMPGDTLHDAILTFKTSFYYHVNSRSHKWHEQSDYRFEVGESPFLFFANYPISTKTKEVDFINCRFDKKMDSSGIFTLELFCK